MDNIEMIEKLREKADVTYDEAKGVLECVNWNLLDALIALEKEGKIKEKEPKSYTTKNAVPENLSIDKKESKPEVKEIIKKVLSWLAMVFKKGFDNNFCIDKKEKNIISIPVTLLAIIMIPAFWLVFIVVIIALFDGCSLRFSGPDLGTDSINDVMNKIKITRHKNTAPTDDLDDTK